MEYQIIEKESFEIIGKALRVSMKNGANFESIPNFWMTCNGDGTIERVFANSADTVFPLKTLLGVCADFSHETEEFTYLIATEKSASAVDDTLTTLEVPASTWAMFQSIGPLPDALQSVWKRIWPEFFDAGEYVHGDAPEIEVYSAGDVSSPDYRCEVWIPVVPK